MEAAIAAALERLTNAIDGLRADIRAAAVDTRALVTAQLRYQGELAGLVRDFKDELADLRTRHERSERIDQRMTQLEQLVAVANR